MRTLKISLLVFILSMTTSAQDFWEQTNGPYGGVVENIYFDQYRNTLFAGTAVAGIYYSSDKGQNWERASINIITVYCFKSTEDILLAGTGEGLFESIDNGLTWSKINGDFSNYQIRDILILNNGYIFIATIGIGVYLSIDNGVTWQQKINGLNNGSINCLSVDSSQTLYAGGDELFKSTNFGDEWVQINSPGGWIGTITNENGSIYCLTNGDIFLSTNYGTDWINITQQVSGVNFWNFLISDGMIYGASGGQGIYQTSNNGGSWIEINNGMSGGDFIVHNIILVDTAIYGATNSGVIMSPTDDFTWQRVNHNLIICIIRSMFNINNLTYTGTHELSLYYTNDDGETWEEVNYDFQSYILSSSVNSFGHIFLGTVNSGIFRSTDNGINWVNVGLNNFGIRTMAINSYDFVFAGTESNGIYFSNNNGGNWQVVNNGLLNLYIRDMKIDYTNKIYVGTQAGVYTSTNNGTNWQLAGIQNKIIFKILIQNSDTIFACTYGEVYKSTDSGLNWVAINVGLPNTEINDITINLNNELYIATWQGVFRSFDGGVNWYAVNDGLTNTKVSSLVINENNILFCGTSGGGVFKSSMPSLVREDRYNFTNSYYLLQNYPNPFNPTTNIEFQILDLALVSLKIFDVLGREVVTLLDEEKPAGVYEVEFDGSILPSGIYFYQLKIGSYLETKKMVLIR